MRLGIIGAMDYEVELIISRMRDIEKQQVAGLEITSGVINTIACDVVVSGIGKVNAALCTQILITEYKVTHLINSGIAGAIKYDLAPGDVIISQDLMYHDFDVTADGYAMGVIPRLESSTFVADNKLVALAEKHARHHLEDERVRVDRIVSGDIFVADVVRKQAILKIFDAAATEMEGAAIAHVCVLNKVPFVVIRAISDCADGSADVDFEKFAYKAALNSSDIVIKMIEELSE